MTKIVWVKSNEGFPTQDLVLQKPLDANVVPFNLSLVERVGQKQLLQFELQTMKPLVNFALENYAHRYLDLACCIGSFHQ